MARLERLRHVFEAPRARPSKSGQLQRSPAVVARARRAMAPRQEARLEAPNLWIMFHHLYMAMGQNPNRTPSEHPNPNKNRPKWVVHLPQNGTIGFDPQTHIVLQRPYNMDEHCRKAFNLAKPTSFTKAQSYPACRLCIVHFGCKTCAYSFRCTKLTSDGVPHLWLALSVANRSPAKRWHAAPAQMTRLLGPSALFVLSVCLESPTQFLSRLTQKTKGIARKK